MPLPVFYDMEVVSSTMAAPTQFFNLLNANSISIYEIIVDSRTDLAILCES